MFVKQKKDKLSTIYLIYQNEIKNQSQVAE